ncbi:MAG: hypothetical protein ABSF95_09205 [Verrucomicrobiota bacterium]|jgi:hypothetical protein
MTTKQWMLIALTLVLGALSLYLNRDWFAKSDIQIYHRSRPARFFRRRAANQSAVEPIVFGFDHRLRLSSLKIISLDALRTNKYARPVWELVSDSNSVPTKDFLYGMNIRGMRPTVKGLLPEPLRPGVPYRLYVQVGKQKAEHDFTPEAPSP